MDLGSICAGICIRNLVPSKPELQRHLTRGKLWATFRNTGTQGLRDDSRLGADAGLMYPGWGIGERDFTEYWIIGQDSDHRYHTSQGEGFWGFHQRRRIIQCIYLQSALQYRRHL